jgi:hypothetical protein
MKYCDDLEKQLTQGIEYKEKLGTSDFVKNLPPIQYNYSI